ncbi:MAG: hypothetical protein JWQ38_2668 [Flavipsychrobacter sp.]|nr:hypothetical protein [Flavipsychrobacter sp.]
MNCHTKVLVLSAFFCLLLVAISCKKKQDFKTKRWHYARYQISTTIDSLNNKTVESDSSSQRDTTFSVSGMGSSNVTFGNLTLPMNMKTTDYIHYYKQTDLEAFAELGYYPAKDSAVISVSTDVTYGTPANGTFNNILKMVYRTY